MNDGINQSTELNTHIKMDQDIHLTQIYMFTLAKRTFTFLSNIFFHLLPWKYICYSLRKIWDEPFYTKLKSNKNGAFSETFAQKLLHFPHINTI